jgi:outer membrane protein assembly factor BamD (BamD/ComL family)
MQKSRLYPLLYIGFICWIFPVFTVHPQNFEAQRLLRFADSLFQEGDYHNAIHEYKRYIFIYPEITKRDLVQLSLAASYQNSGQFRAAIAAYQTLIETYPKSPLCDRAQTNIAQCQLLLGDEPKAVASLQQFLADNPQSELAPRAQFTLGIIQMDERNWKAASQAWQQVGVKYPQTPFVEVSERLAHLVQRGESLPRRSPAISGLLSTAVPGLGQIYSGRFRDGLYSLIVVGGIAAGTAYYIDQERYEVAVPVGIVGLFFYAGNIYGGFQSAKAFNHQYEERFLNQLRKQIRETQLFGATPPKSADLMLVRWHSRF